jgi:hypothetical protein
MRRWLISLTALAMGLALAVPAFAQTSSDYFLHCPVRLSDRGFSLDSPIILFSNELVSSR